MTTEEIYLHIFKKMADHRMQFDQELDDTALYFYPSAPSFFFTTKRDNQKKLYDATGRLAAGIYANMLFGYLTNPAIKWIELEFINNELNTNAAAISWLKKLEQQIHTSLMLSNFNTAIGEFYHDFVCFGTGIVFVEEDDVFGLRFYNVPLAESYIEENSKEEIDRVYRKMRLTGFKLKEMFGDKLPSEVLETIEKDPVKEHYLLHIVEPREVFDPSKADALNMPFKSIKGLLGDTNDKLRILSESGYRRFPFFVPRHTKMSWTPYGTSPCREELPNMKSLNELVKSYVLNSARECDPPLDMPAKGYYSVLNKTPGAINYRRPNLGKEETIRRLLPEPKFSPAETMIENFRQQIKSSLYNDLFMVLVQLPRMTATEVIERSQEKMVLLGQVIGRLKNELFDKIIDYMAQRMIELGRVEPPPDFIQQQGYEIKLTSLLAKAQKFSEIRNVQNFFVSLAQLAQYSPQSLDVINFDKIVEELVDLAGLPNNVLRTSDEIEQIRQARLAVMAAQQAMQQQGQQQ
ncbi:MAG: head-to-tail joining protein [Patescibacteria group bacterium]|nr:MAG: head-to-tail joining protein [Patescibacteria group bacterium]